MCFVCVSVSLCVYVCVCIGAFMSVDCPASRLLGLFEALARGSQKRALGGSQGSVRFSHQMRMRRHHGLPTCRLHHLCSMAVGQNRNTLVYGESFCVNKYESKWISGDYMEFFSKAAPRTSTQSHCSNKNKCPPKHHLKALLTF